MSSSAQTSAPHVATSSKHYCHKSAGFCFRYPASWILLGDIFDGAGVVIAPEQSGDREQWDDITIALVASPDENGDGPTLNAIVDRTTSAMREAGQNFETLQRRELTVNHSPAQSLKARYRENATGHDWVEELVFIQGQDNDIFSVALKCAPDHLMRMEPALKEVLASWTVPEPQPPAERAPSEPAPPASSSPPAQSTQPKEAR